MLKEKICKGTGKAKGFGCGKIVPQEMYGKPNRVYGIGRSCGCFSNWLLNSVEGKKKIAASALKASKARIDLENAFKEKKERIGLNTLLKNTVISFHAYVRERDKGKPCIACGAEWKPDFHASHYFKAENYSLLKFNEFNVNGGCISCNIRKEGNLGAYSINLPIKIGTKRFEEINSLAEMEKKTNHKWDREWLVEKRRYYQEKIKELKKSEK